MAKRKTQETTILRREIAAPPTVADKGVIEGYASLFVQDLRSNSHGELFAPGCFAKAIADLHDAPLAAGEPSRIAVSLRHNWSDGFAVPMVLREDEQGLWTQTQARLIAPGEVNHGDWTQIKAGVLTGISIEFDSARSKYEFLSETEARALGFEGEWNQCSTPRRWTEVYLYGFSYVLHPSMSGARILATRSAEQREGALDEAQVLEMIRAAVAAECGPYSERMGAIEARLAALEVEETMPEEPEEMPAATGEEASRAAEVEALRLEVLCLRHPNLSQDQGRALLRLPEQDRQSILSALPVAQRATPSIPALGKGTSASEGGKVSLEDLHTRAIQEASGDHVKALEIYRKQRLQGA